MSILMNLPLTHYGVNLAVPRLVLNWIYHGLRLDSHRILYCKQAPIRLSLRRYGETPAKRREASCRVLTPSVDENNIAFDAVNVVVLFCNSTKVPLLVRFLFSLFSLILI